MPPCGSSNQQATLTGVGEVRIPRHCTTGRIYSGFELQRCIGESLGWRIGMNSSASTIRAATCTLAQLLWQGVIDDCHMAAHGVGHALVASHRRQEANDDDDLAATALLLVPRCRLSSCSDGCMHAVMTSLIGVAIRRLRRNFHDGPASGASGATPRDAVATVYTSACGREVRAVKVQARARHRRPLHEW